MGRKCDKTQLFIKGDHIAVFHQLPLAFFADLSFHYIMVGSKVSLMILLSLVYSTVMARPEKFMFPGRKHSLSYKYRSSPSELTEKNLSAEETKATRLQPLMLLILQLKRMKQLIDSQKLLSQ